MPIFRRTKTVRYCTWCAALVLLDVVGSGCGALRFRVRALWRLLSNSNLQFAHDARSQKPKARNVLFATDALTRHAQNLMTLQFLLFIKSQFTTNAQNILHLNQWPHGHIWSRTVAPFQSNSRALFGYPDWGFLWFSSVESQMKGYSMQSRGTTRTPLPQSRLLHPSAWQTSHNSSMCQRQSGLGTQRVNQPKLIPPILSTGQHRP